MESFVLWCILCIATKGSKNFSILPISIPALTEAIRAGDSCTQLNCAHEPVEPANPEEREGSIYIRKSSPPRLAVGGGHARQSKMKEPCGFKLHQLMLLLNLVSSVLLSLLYSAYPAEILDEDEGF